MNVGLILLSWGICGLVLILGLMGSGIVSIQIEIVDEDKKSKPKDDEEASTKS